MAGLSAAASLLHAGRRPVVIDKGRGLGGRIASRRIGGATFDHGAQFMTAHHPRFAAAIDEWKEAGLVREWSRGFGGKADGHIRWRGTAAMTGVVKEVGRGVEVCLGVEVLVIRNLRGEWVAETVGGGTFSAPVLVLTAPVPQCLAILGRSGIGFPEERLGRIQYERCLAVMAVLDGQSQVPSPGGLVPGSGPIGWIADNQMKGISAEPAVTIHATHDFSMEHWEGDRQASGRRLLEAAREWLGAGVQTFQVHGWRYSKPIQVEEQPFFIIQEAPLLMLAGDAFAGPRVEGAAESGWAAAGAILQAAT